MASCTTKFSINNFNPTHLTKLPISTFNGTIVKFAIKKVSLSLSSSQSISNIHPLVHKGVFSVDSYTQMHKPLTVVSAKGYKMKTHKASAKRFRVTGSGKIVRRRAGKQHLLAKKNNKRKLRLSKMLQVDRSDYNNVIGALPYLKVKSSILPNSNPLPETVLLFTFDKAKILLVLKARSPPYEPDMLVCSACYIRELKSTNRNKMLMMRVFVMG
ncbi:50S ribosomal protein L35 [Heracleum sosnowskyi]|uniref:50S ribosomal protein L35 n=1 Tax=Heracleum sosnowskyi TaxID=360622 RepID=A0AAD8IWC2_9APIA|nr:50S ribosomal protein L35 [Heracleum sosnowskyi]